MGFRKKWGMGRGAWCTLLVMFLVGFCIHQVVLGSWVYHALEADDYPRVKALVLCGAPVNVLYQPIDNGGGETPLWMAYDRNDLWMFRYLLYRGADPNTCSPEGITLLMQAAGAGQLDLLRRLLGRGAEVNAQSGQDWTALMAAAVEGHHEAVRLLLKAGANPSLRNVRGETALELARQRSHSAVVRLLEVHAVPGQSN